MVSDAVLVFDGNPPPILSLSKDVETAAARRRVFDLNRGKASDASALAEVFEHVVLTEERREVGRLSTPCLLGTRELQTTHFAHLITPLTSWSISLLTRSDHWSALLVAHSRQRVRPPTGLPLGALITRWRPRLAYR